MYHPPDISRLWNFILAMIERIAKLGVCQSGHRNMNDEGFFLSTYNSKESYPQEQEYFPVNGII